MEKLPQRIHESWHQHLQPLFDDPKMIMIRDQVLTQARYYPERKDIFRVFEMPINQIRVVILGQDPYPNGEGIGLAFAVNLATKIPPSLKIIKNEIEISQAPQYFKKHEDFSWRTLAHWVNQGVFLLNTALTVEVGIQGSHLGYWQWFTREVVKIISINQPCIWMLWGAKAKGFKDYIPNHIWLSNKSESAAKIVETGDNKENLILEADHPAAETYPNSKYKFTGCNHFNLCNEILKVKGLEQIKW